jgi:hypothetical protein
MSRAAVANAWLEGYKPPTERAIEFARLYAEEQLTLQEIANRHSLSRERVRQLIAPFGIPPHKGARQRQERESELREVYARIMTGETTTAEEAERLGYAKPDYLRMAFWRLGLKLHRPAMGEAERQKLARDRYLERAQRGPKKHGTVSAYKNFACRCPRCKAANRKYEREQRRRKLQEKESEI